LAYIYLNKFPIICIFHILYIIRRGPAHSHRAALSQDAGLQL